MKRVAIEVEGTMWEGEGERSKAPARNLIPALHAYADVFEVILIHSRETPRHELMAWLNDLESPWREMGKAAGISDELPRRYLSARVSYLFETPPGVPLLSHRAIYFSTQWPTPAFLAELVTRAS